MVASVRGRAFLVGGAVRDAILGLDVKDFDIEVFGVEPEKLKNVVASKYAFKECGVSFGVLKLNDFDIDISLPRRESKTGLGHRAFEIESDPYLSVEEAASRRDFTINAIYRDILDESFLDPYGGMKDLKDKILRHVSPKFVEDPLRVLRGAQFVARFSLNPAMETVSLCKAISMESLAAERVFEEWSKLLLKGVEISKGLEFLRLTRWIGYFPELERLIGCRQHREHHPEGDVWEHTKCCMDAFAKNRIGDSHEDLVVGFAVLCHDFGKPLCTRFDKEKGYIRSCGHDQEGEIPTRSFLRRLTNEERFIDEVIPLVKCHMRPFALWKSHSGEGAVRRLAAHVGRIDRLLRVCRADDLGRPPYPSNPEPLEYLAAEAERLNVKFRKPAMIFRGRDLVDRGYKPGPAFKKILDKMYECQLDGKFHDHKSAVVYFEKNFAVQ